MMRHLAIGAIFSVVFATAAHAQTAQSFAAQAPVNCTLKPIQIIDISSQITGVAANVFVRPGQKVTAGTPILQLDTDIAEADLKLAQQRAAISAPLDVAQIRVAALQKRLARVEKAYRRRATSAVEFEDAQLEYNLAVADVAQQEQQMALLKQQAERAELAISKSTIFSPVDGIIGEGLTHVGEQIGIEPIATLFVVDALRAEAFVPLIHLPKIRAATSFELIIDGNQDTLAMAKLDYISPVANLASNTISVYFSVEDQNVISGSRCELKVPE